MRLMSDDELTRFQVALATLQEQWHGGALAALARVYSNHVMQANSPAFFLPWNRLFLRQFEQLLQQVDCTVTLPYFDFTTHVGNFTNAPLWNSAYFGGKGCTSDSTAASQPCVSRRFSSIQLPSAVEIAIAMATNDYMTMSASLETYAFLVHEFVGGHMATSAAVYDPAFYALHAYVDALWDRWQHRSGGDGGSYPPEYVDVTMLPFNVAPADALDSAAQTCVAYPRSPARACDSSIPYQRAVDILQRQGDGFLRTVGRTCPPLVAPSSRVAYRLGVGDRMQQQLPALPVAKAMSDVSRSACFDVELFTHSSCPCEQPIATCKFNPCSATCDAYPDAVCTLDFCGSCVGHWSRGGAPVKCHKDGARCDQRINVCVYPLATGNCDMPMKRYFYNMTTGSCDEFQFSGCDGNLNNFESSDECEGICTVGACCHRQLTRPPGGAVGRYLYSSPTCEVMAELGHPYRCQLIPFVHMVCIDGLGGSHSEQSWWQSTEDECHNCTCVGGQQQCEHRGCPATPCTHPVHPDDSCCPLCTDCLLDNVTHADGAPIRTADPCEECRCDGGSVMCRVGPCECDHKGRLYEHGESFYDGHPCINCTCNKGDVTCERLDLLCRPRCAHPARVRGGDVCCPTCDNCEYHGSYYRNGQKFTMTTDGMCQLCSCEDGDVTCAVEKCESPQCDNPEVVAGSCCLHCPPLCTIGVAVYEEGDIWVDEADACKTCVCKASQAVCTEDLCVPVSCSHPSKPADSCCPVCERCQVSELTYDNGQQFTHADDPCQTCSCAHGNITCEPVGCPTLQCDTPCPPDNPNCRKAQPGECCPTCNVCTLRGSTYGDGTSFTSPLDSCQVCECDYPYVTCKRLPCPPAACHHRASGCCAACVDCNYGKPHVEQRRGVSSVRWTTVIGCCKECTDCYIDGQQVADGASLDYEHSCITCECRHGNGECHQRACTPVGCSHPVTTGCCPECGSCEYKDQLVLNGQLFAEPDDPCVSCECHQGNISCGPLQCPTVACTHPSRGQCCLECHTCNYGDRVYANGERFEDETRPCEECNCKSGNVECSVKNCPLVSCSDPKPGPCCPECNRPCSHHGQMYKHGQTFPSLDEECNECVCSDGEVSCHIRPCPPVRCTHPRDGACCQTCDSGCLFLDKVYAAGASLTNPANKCEVCRCYGGDMQCHTLDCPTLSCSSTYIPAVSHKFRVDCFIRNGYTNCGLKPCPACSHPKLVDGACCPTCTDCFYHGQEYTNGSDFSAGCEQCACVNGDVTCAPLTCPDLDCDNPVLPLDECCPICPQCSVDGLTFRDGENFPNPADRCENCTCRGTAVHCVRRPCTATCAHPVPDKCCPQCDGCYYKHQTYTNKQLFKPGPCQTCVCDDGSVTCTADKCAELSCQFRIRDPGSCCERCQGCSYEGQEYEEHAIWPSKHDSCVKCTCHQGVVTCARKHCMTPCARSFLRPGQCCPVCRGCYYKGALHISGKVFHPDNDICQTCQCEGGALQCWKETCPALLDCPADEVLPPAHDQCCPHCARHLVSSCTALSVDVVPTSDPCYTCRCSQHGSWLCERRQCPLLSNCPQSEIYMPPGECCQKCKLCYSEADGAFFRDGHVWPAMTDPCEQHSCRGGVVSTSRLVCPVLHCRPDELRQLLPFDCCEECVHRSNLTCIVSGQLHSGGERWQLDDCTHCVCEEGENLCTVQTCEPLNCRPDQVPFMAPGACCPECITRPVTCVGFGDPHYRTFDGNMVHFQGTCRYVLAADCVTGNFTVEVVNTDRGHRGSVAWTESVTVKIAGSVYDLLRQGRVRVNGEDVDLPLLHRPQVLVEKTGNTIMLTTNVGMKVLWNGDSYAEVSVQPAYMRKMCGLCGNYNSYPPDDLRMRSGDLTTSAAVFGNSWKVPDSSRESQCKDAIDIDPCVQGGYAARKLATTKCAVIRGPIFRPCHRVVSPEPFFASCVYDLCACAHTEPCLCDILGTYALECAQAGVTLNWRSEALCDEQCDTELGLIWEECGPPCHRTCANKEVALSKLNAECYKPCVPGCRCSADRVLYDGQCIAPSDCPV
ncbi:PREDICTED: kielin/chordin-like protein [Priapulus caudatus]|uniref:Kielin/chordin-like protein n=1 Tax=Priapulus caudatus TaxID=37621 RepID=A0ABM1EUY3_PRICU|nr:PREDICTED: kielin/chordin-like protein [Priapulus caudatus]